MSKNCENRCPGCGKHCRLGAERCKYGRRYFAKAAQKPARKWEKYVLPGGDAWHLLDTSRRVKKALKGGTDEAQLFSALDTQERAQLRSLLAKLDADIHAKPSADQTH